MITVAKYIAKFLISKDVKHIFGFQGSAMLKILDEAASLGINYIQNFNEQASGFAADAYARVNKKLGVAIATSGPGAVNLIGGIANAYQDSIPVLFITGQDYLTSLKNDNGARQNGFQDLDIVSAVKNLTKYAVLLDDPNNVKYELEKAYYLATNGRCGSVLIDVPIDVQFMEVDENNLKGFEIPKKEEFDYKINDVIKLLKNSKRPVILAGGGIQTSCAKEELKELNLKTKIPVVTTLMGGDCFEDKLGFSGLHGNSVSNLAILKADLILALGTRLSIKQTGKIKENYTNANIVHVDIDKTELKRTFLNETLSIKGDVKEFLNKINKENFSINIENWLSLIEEWKNKFEDTICDKNSKLDPVIFLREITKYIKDDTVITTDVGANQMWTNQALRLKNNQRLLNSGGFGAMGYSLPAAIGASYVAPLCVSITGDGGLQMNLQELNTLSLRRNNVKCFVFNNNNLALMRDCQKRYYNSHFWGNNEKEFTCPDIKKLADTFNLKYEKIEDKDDFSKLKDIFSNNEPYLIDVILDKDTKLLNRYDDKALKNE